MSEEFESGATSAEPRTYGDGFTLTPIDPPKADEPLPFESNTAGLEDAAAERDRTAGERNIVEPLRFVDPVSGEVLDGDKVTSPEFAADELTRHRAAKAERISDHLKAEMAQEIEERRVAEFNAQYGTQEPPAEAPQPQPEQIEQQYYEPQPEAPPPEPTELDRLLAPLPPEARQPFIDTYNRTLYEAQTNATAQAQAMQQQYHRAIAEAGVALEATAAAPFPELAQAPLAERQAILAHIERTNPQRGAEIRAHISRVKDLAANQLAAVQQAQQQAAQQQQYAQQEQVARVLQAFHNYAASEDQKFEQAITGESPESLAAIRQEALAMLREDGMTDAQIAFAWANDPTFRSARAQKMLLKAAKQSLAEKNMRFKRATPPVPRVMKPGVAEPASDRSEYAELQREFRGKSSLSPKEAARLIIARRATNH